ncbi:MAG: helix-turn-helix domain-containing protein [Bdellovibrionales bacterium]|nr:helix-turn-helix domain-containing protein [Bdellovibrionales bacterium]
MFLENFKWFNTKEAAVYLGTTPKQIRNWVYQGKVKSYKLLGRGLRFQKNDLDLLLKGEKNGHHA